MVGWEKHPAGAQAAEAARGGVIKSGFAGPLLNPNLYRNHNPLTGMRFLISPLLFKSCAKSATF